MSQRNLNLRFATFVSSNEMVPNLLVSANRSTFDDFTSAHQKEGETQIVFNLLVFEHTFKLKLFEP